MQNPQTQVYVTRMTDSETLMMLVKVLCLLSLVCVLATIPVFTQDAKISQIPRSNDSDPFKLATGSSFYAAGSGSSRPPAATSKEAVAADFEAALEIIRNNHADGPRFDAETLTSGAITSMLKTLDPHSNYYRAKDYQDLLGEHESEYSGTGSSIAGFFQKRSGRNVYSFNLSGLARGYG